jgi:hypothetical protein
MGKNYRTEVHNCGKFRISQKRNAISYVEYVVCCIDGISLGPEAVHSVLKILKYSGNFFNSNFEKDDLFDNKQLREM